MGGLNASFRVFTPALSSVEIVIIPYFYFVPPAPALPLKRNIVTRVFGTRGNMQNIILDEMELVSLTNRRSSSITH